MRSTIARQDEVPQPLLLRQVEGDLLWLTLNRPPAHAFSMEMIATLQQEIDRAASDSSVRVVILAATGKIFCAGHDLKEIRAHHADADGGRAYLQKLFSACSTLMQSIARLPKPVIAAIDGVASAAGCQLVASVDIAIASSRSSFATPGVAIGGFCATPMVALTRRVSPGKALEMLLTGEPIDAETARECGLVSRVVAPEYLNQTVRSFAQVLVSRSPQAIAQGKQTFYRQLAMPLAEAYDLAGEVMVEGFVSAGAREGIDAFLARRDPNWSKE